MLFLAEWRGVAGEWEEMYVRLGIVEVSYIRLCYMCVCVCVFILDDILVGALKTSKQITRIPRIVKRVTTTITETDGRPCMPPCNSGPASGRLWSGRVIGI